MSQTHKLFIRPDGTLECIYIDEIQPLIAQAEEVKISRGSNVEPNSKGEWVADMSVLSLPSSQPFALRADALAWEVDVINDHLRGNS